MGAKIKRPEELWEVWSDKGKPLDDNYVMTEEMLEQIKKAHGIN